jgi:hypothetical protein
MTTTTEVVQVRSGQCHVGKQRMLVTAVTVNAGGFSWDLYVNAKDEWWSGCGNCDADSGFKSCYAGIYGGVCFQCGGIGIARVAGTEDGMIRKIRARVSSRNSRQNAVQRAAEKAVALAQEWMIAHPNLASDLARIRATEPLGNNVLGDMALALTRGPLSVKQARYATALLVARAWEDAHATKVDEVPSVHAGSVGERLTFTGEITVWVYLPSERFDRSASVLVIVDARNADGEQTLIKMVTSAAWAFEAKKGDSVTVRATVKEHIDSDQYGPQTVVKGPKLVEEK